MIPFAKNFKIERIRIFYFSSLFLKAMKEERINLLKCVLVGALGFGIGGVVWGWSIPTTAHYAVPFTYTTGAIALGSLGGVSLALFSKDIKKILKLALVGTVGFFIGFIVGLILSYPYLLWLWGWIPRGLLTPKIWEAISVLKPSLMIGDFFFSFVIVGAIGGFFYGLALKKNIRSFTLSGAIGFGIGSLIAPVIGNLVEKASGSLLAAYVTTFMIIGVILGAFLGRTMYLTEKQTINQKEKE